MDWVFTNKLNCSKKKKKDFIYPNASTPQSQSSPMQHVFILCDGELISANNGYYSSTHWSSNAWKSKRSSILQIYYTK